MALLVLLSAQIHAKELAQPDVAVVAKQAARGVLALVKERVMALVPELAPAVAQMDAASTSHLDNYLHIH